MKYRGSMLSLLIGLVIFVVAVPAPAPAAVTVGGFTVLDAIWSDKINGVFAPRVGIAGTPLDTDKDRDNNQATFSARRSRLWAIFTDTVGGVKMSGRIEGDFNTAEGNGLTSNSQGFRLREAYARGDDPSGFFLLAGQAKSIVNNDDIAFLGKYTIDDVNSAAASMNGSRQPQLRAGWTTSLGPGAGSLTLAAAIEKHSVQNLGSASVDESQGEGQDTPLLGASVVWDHPIVRLHVRGAAAKNKVTITGGTQKDDQAWILAAATEIKLPPVTIFGNAFTQKGLGRLTGGAGDFPSVLALAPGTNDVTSIESQGFYVGIAFNLTPTTQLDALYGWHKADQELSQGFTGAQLEKQESIELNVRQRFWNNWLLGVEYRYYKVEAFNGTEGKNNQFAVALYYFF